MKSKNSNVVRFRCPECSNYINGTQNDKGVAHGTCPVCKSVIFAKQQSVKEKQIRIIKCSNVN